MNRCKTCKHWAPIDPNERIAFITGSGECQNTPEIWEVTERLEIDDYTRRHLKPAHAAVLAVVEDGSSYRARLVTMPDFGCVQHEEVPCL